MPENYKLDEDEFEISDNENTESNIDDISDSIDARSSLKTHEKLSDMWCGHIVQLSQGYAKVQLTTTEEMALDRLGVVHNGFLFASADYAAAIAVNEPNTITIGTKSKFLAPIKRDDTVEFEAKAKFFNTKKREVSVIGSVNGIKIYEGVFHAVVMDNHIFQTKHKVDRTKKMNTSID